MLDAGDPAPDFLLPAVDQPDAEYMLSAAADAGPVVLAFVPDSASEASSLLDTLANLDWAALTDRISVFGIGGSEQVLATLATDLPFPVLYDYDEYVANLYGIADREAGAGTRRALVLADQRCTIRFAWEASEPADSPPIEDVADAIRSL